MLFLTLSAAQAFADNAVVGGAYLASPHPKFPCEQAIRHVDAAPIAYHATMWNTFGRAGNRCWRKLIKKTEGKPFTLQFYLSNEVCRRKGNCYKQELLNNLSVSQYNNHLCSGHRKTVKKVKKRAEKIRQFCERHGHEQTRCLLAIGLESQFSKCAAEKLVEYVSDVGWDKANVIHNPVHGSPAVKHLAGAYYLEHHNTELHFPSGLPARQRIITLDGIDPDYCRDKNGRECIGNRISETDLQKWTDDNRNRTAYIGHWCSCHQGIEGDTSTSPDPRKRTPYVNANDVSKFIKHARYDTAAPTPPQVPDYNTKRCNKVMEGKDGPGGFLWKHSEKGGLVVLFPGKYKVQFKRVVVLKPNGAREKLTWSGWHNPDPQGDRQHWRHSKNPDQFPDKSVVRATFQTSIFSANQNHCWKIEDASERND